MPPGTVHDALGRPLENLRPLCMPPGAAAWRRSRCECPHGPLRGAANMSPCKLPLEAPGLPLFHISRSLNVARCMIQHTSRGLSPSHGQATTVITPPRALPVALYLGCGTVDGRVSRPVAFAMGSKDRWRIARTTTEQREILALRRLRPCAAGSAECKSPPGTCKPHGRLLRRPSSVVDRVLGNNRGEKQKTVQRHGPCLDR